MARSRSITSASCGSMAPSTAAETTIVGRDLDAVIGHEAPLVEGLLKDLALLAHDAQLDVEVLVGLQGAHHRARP